LLADDPSALNQAYNIACGDQITLLQLFDMLKQNLQRFDAAIAGIEPVFGAIRPGDIPHSLADISKARRYLNYDPEWNVEQGIAQAAEWYYRNL
jgi:UDP-N-acetylglucosamine 4-epimerase